ncbi:MAG: hypothetical protein WAU28_05095 [Candidatus Moraniibacteriota bacterium]
MNFDTPPKINQETAVIPPAPVEQIPSDEPANPESEARAMTAEMLAIAQSNRETRVEELGFTLDSLKKQYPGAFKFLRIAGAVVALLMASEAAHAGGPVVRGPVVRDAVIHAAKPINYGISNAPVIRDAAPVSHGKIYAPGEKRMPSIVTTNQATPSNFKETPPSTNASTSKAAGDIYKDSNGNVSGNVRGGIDLTRG